MRLIFLVIIFSLFGACSKLERRRDRAARWFEDNGHLKVVATTSMLSDLVRGVGGERVDVWTLIAPGHDPHSYELVKGDSDFLQRADLVVFSGLGLEHGASMQAIASREETLLVGNYLSATAGEALLYDEGGALDPHIWMDVSLWAKVLKPIEKRLTELRPASAALFSTRAAAMEKKLLDLHSACRKKLMGLSEKRRYLVTAHDAFRYFTRAYLSEEGEKGWEKRLAAAEGLAPHAQVSLTDLKDVSHFIEEHAVSCIFPESYLSRAFLQKLLRGLNAQAHVSEKGLCADTMLEEADFDYCASMRHNSEVIYEALHE